MHESVKKELLEVIRTRKRTPLLIRLAWHDSGTYGIKDLHQDLDGGHLFCAGGRAQHRITLRTPTAKPSPAFLQLLIYDQHELQDRMGMKVSDSCDNAVMGQLQAMQNIGSFPQRGGAKVFVAFRRVIT